MDERDQFDEELEAILNAAPDVEHWFYSKVAGVTHINSDGTSRQSQIRECKPLDALILTHEKDNPVDENAVAVYRVENHGQVGYLERRLARETVQRCRKGEAWTALVARKRGGEEGKETFGLTIIMAKKKVKKT